MSNTNKKFLSGILILGITFLCFMGCDSLKEYTPSELKSTWVSQEDFSKTVEENSDRMLTDHISLAMVIPDINDGELFQSSSIQLDQEDLNYLIKSNSQDRVVSIIAFSINTYVQGYAIYSLNDSGLNLQLDFQDNSTNYKVNGVILQDILYVQKNNCKGCDFLMLKATPQNSDFDLISQGPSDISLERLRNKHFKKSSDGQYQLIKPMQDNLHNIPTSINQSSEVYDFCGVTHWCKRGAGQQCDAWRAFCFDLDASNCAQESMIQFEIANINSVYTMASSFNQAASLGTEANLNNTGSVFATTLPSQMLYSIRNNLQQSIGGDIYVDFYYELSGHFSETLDISLSFDILAMSVDLLSVTNNYLFGSSGTRLFDDNFYQKAVAVMQKSKNNSNSLVYKETVDIMLGEMARYKNKSVGEVNNLLNNPYY